MKGICLLASAFFIITVMMSCAGENTHYIDLDRVNT